MDQRVEPWPASSPGVLVLPSGRVLRGRGLRHPQPSGLPPTFGVYLLGRRPDDLPWETAWIPWPDFRLPKDHAAAKAVLRSAWQRAGAERVEIACGGGRGRTGTALACIAILDGVPAAEAVQFVRNRYSLHAIETPWQRRFVERFAG